LQVDKGLILAYRELQHIVAICVQNSHVLAFLYPSHLLLPGYLMCFFDEKLSDALLVGLPDYEFAVRNTHVSIFLLGLVLICSKNIISSVFRGR
jgi:hypothetical protein